MVRVAVAVADTVAEEAEACTLVVPAGVAVPEVADTGVAEDTVEGAEVALAVPAVLEAADTEGLLAVPGRAVVRSMPVLVSFSELHK